jgi:hypothetical protein
MVALKTAFVTNTDATNVKLAAPLPKTLSGARLSE